MSSEIPGSWTSCEIGEVSKVVGGGTPPSKDETNFTTEDGIPWITPADLSGYKKIYIDRGARNLTEKGFSSCSAVKIPAGSVLFSSRAPVGYVAIASKEVSTNQGFKSFVLKDGLDSRFVYFYLRHIKATAEAMATGTTFKELSGAVAAKLPLVVAPQNEQKRIADKLVTLLTRVDACRNRLDTLPLLLKRFRQAVLSAATSGQLTEDWRKVRKVSSLDGWRTLNLREVCVKITDGTHHSPKNYASGSYEYVTAKNIRPWGLDLNNISYVDESTHNEIYARCPVEKGDVLYIKDGVTTGLACINTLDRPFSMLSSVALLKPNKDIICGSFLVMVLNSPNFREVALGEMTGSAIRRLVLRQINELKISVPTSGEQQEIVRRVDKLFAFADRLEARYKSARKRVDILTPSLLDKAFRGDLIPQDPNDEPAEELLERISTSKLVMGDKPKRGRQKRTQETEGIVLDLSQIQSDHLSNILKKQGRQTSKSLWQASQLAIEDFYEQLRAEEAQELLREIKQGAESFLEAA